VPSLHCRYINLYREENLTSEFLSINPTGTIPALVDVDGNVKVWDSHAIGIYLVQKFAGDDQLYPKDFLKRTAINERLFFEASFLSSRLFEICVRSFENILRFNSERKFYFRIPSAMAEKHQSHQTKSSE
jgi:glutathione S-transferase